VSALRTPGLARFVAARPSRALTLARAGWRLRRAHWWRHAPFVPVPDERYWEFRRATAFGSQGSPTPRDLLDAAEWSLRQPRGRGVQR